jgi:hypothetical protein
MVLEAPWSSLTQVPITKLGAVTFMMLSGISVLAASPMVNAADAQFCKDYAERAAQEAARAEGFDCAFHGPRWMKDAELHRGWCLGAAKTVVQAEVAARRTDLRLCICGVVRRPGRLGHPGERDQNARRASCKTREALTASRRRQAPAPRIRTG